MHVEHLVELQRYTWGHLIHQNHNKMHRDVQSAFHWWVLFTIGDNFHHVPYRTCKVPMSRTFSCRLMSLKTVRDSTPSAANPACNGQEAVSPRERRPWSGTWAWPGNWLFSHLGRGTEMQCWQLFWNNYWASRAWQLPGTRVVPQITALDQKAGAAGKTLLLSGCLKGNRSFKGSDYPNGPKYT